MIYKNILNLCKEKKISVSKLEKETGLANGTVGKWRSFSPTIDNVKKVAEFFGVTIDSLVSEAKVAG